jgi:hypothetical protein
MAKQIAKSHSECVKAYAKEQLLTEHEQGHALSLRHPTTQLRAEDTVLCLRRNQLRTDNTDLKKKVDAMNAGRHAG